MFDWKCKIFFLRHGSTIYTKQNRFYDFEDYPPLNEKGRIEIQKAAKWLKENNPNIDSIYTSSALRSVQSANLISRVMKKDFEVLDSLYERKSGVLGGLTYAQLEKKHPEIYKDYEANPCSFWPQDGESIEDLNNRVEHTLKELINANHQKRILIITHSAIIQSAISFALGIPIENQGKVYIPNGSATQINYSSHWASLVYSGFIP